VRKEEDKEVYNMLDSMIDLASYDDDAVVVMGNASVNDVEASGLGIRKAGDEDDHYIQVCFLVFCNI
jgi:hypothetical protein